MTEDTVDAVIIPRGNLNKKVPSIENLSSEMPGRGYHRKDRGKRMLKTFINRLRMRTSASADISEPDPSFKVAYLGNVVTGWAKGDGCVEKPLATLWRNYTQSSRPDVRMQLLVSGGGLKATTRDHGLTEYWAHRLTTCSAPTHFPRLFCWVYRHEGRRLRHELRCHAVLCQSAAIARQIEVKLKESLALALAEFRKEKISKQNARLSLANSVYENPSIPRRKILLSTGASNYRPPLERSKSAPKLTMIEENLEEEIEEDLGKCRNKVYRHSASVSALIHKRDSLRSKLESCRRFAPISERVDDEEESQQREREIRITFSEDLTTDERSELILAELAEESMLLETCDMNGWLRNFESSTERLPDSDDGSLSSGCESASTVTSDLDQNNYNNANHLESDLEEVPSSPDLDIVSSSPAAAKTEVTDFKLGGSVLSRVRSFERISNGDIRKLCGMKTVNSILESDEVSLIPVGETHTDFSSLKVFKKRCATSPHRQEVDCKSSKDVAGEEEQDCCDGSEEESGSACSDESGYDEVIDCASSVANIVLV